MRRHPQLSLRQPQTTNWDRAQSFNTESVNEFLYLLERIVESIPASIALTKLA